MKTNIKAPGIKTAEGAPAKRISDEEQLERLVMSCMLFENNFYSDGKSVADSIYELSGKLPAITVMNMAKKARNEMNLRHAPLWMICGFLDKNKGATISEFIRDIIQRVDELTELIAMWWKKGKRPIPSSMKKGIAKAFNKFNEYDLAKYNRDGAVKLRDALFLCHPKPVDYNQDILWKKLIGGHCSKCFLPRAKSKKRNLPTCRCGGEELKLSIPDTWETRLSSGADKRKAFTGLIVENKLGGMALLRNLRNMSQAGVDNDIVKAAIERMKTNRILPFRFIAAAKYAPNLEPQLEAALFKNVIESKLKMKGKTILLIDVSESMDYALSTKSDMCRLDAACGLAMICKEICENVEIYSFSNNVVTVPPRSGFALRDAIVNSQDHGGTDLGKAVKYVNNLEYDRLIVFTDEQSRSPVPNPKGVGYMINVASEKNGVGYGVWNHIDGFSESIISYINKLEE